MEIAEMRGKDSRELALDMQGLRKELFGCGFARLPKKSPRPRVSVRSGAPSPASTPCCASVSSPGRKPMLRLLPAEDEHHR